MFLCIYNSNVYSDYLWIAADTSLFSLMLIIFYNEHVLFLWLEYSNYIMSYPKLELWNGLNRKNAVTKAA